MKPTKINKIIEQRFSTTLYRIAELEGMLTLAAEQTNNIRKQNIAHIEK